MGIFVTLVLTTPNNYTFTFGMKTKYFFLFLIFCGIHLTCVAAKKQEPLTAVLIHELKCSSEKAYSYFIDFEKFGKLHPDRKSVV